MLNSSYIFTLPNILYFLCGSAKVRFWVSEYKAKFLFWEVFLRAGRCYCKVSILWVWKYPSSMNVLCRLYSGGIGCSICGGVEKIGLKKFSTEPHHGASEGASKWSSWISLKYLGTLNETIWPGVSQHRDWHEFPQSWIMVWNLIAALVFTVQYHIFSMVP